MEEYAGQIMLALSVLQTRRFVVLFSHHFILRVRGVCAKMRVQR